MKKMFHFQYGFVFLILLVLSCYSYSFGQSSNSNTKIISGQITDEAGSTLPGVNVIVKGTSNGVVSDIDGNFTIKALPKDVLQFSFIGFITQEILVGNQSQLLIKMASDNKDIDEVVVIGYGKGKKKLITGANSHVSSSEMEDKHSVRIDQALQGMTSGVQITSNSGQPGSGMIIRIRGVGTVGDSNPIYIIDGVPSGDISYLNPSEIESVDVLKDAASAAIYGARAANGVILITTKKGKKGSASLFYDGYTGFQNVVKKPDLLDKYQYAEIQNEIYRNLNPDPAKKGYKLPFSENRADIDTINGTNWGDQMFRKNAPIQNHVLSLTGGNENSHFFTALSYTNQQGIVGLEDQSFYERFNFRINSEHKLYNNKLTIGQNLTYARTLQTGVGVGNIYDNSIRPFLNASPTFPVHDSLQTDGYGRPWKYKDEVNPAALLYYRGKSKNTNDKLFGNVYGEIEIIKGLTFKTDFGIELSYNFSNSYNPIYNLSSLVRNDHSSASQSFGESFSYNFENTLNYNRTFEKNSFNILLGTTVRESSGIWLNGSKQDLILLGLDYAVINNGTLDETRTISGSKWDNSFLSQFGRILYNYDETYLFSATVRRDGSSKFGPENKYGIFPSFSGGVVLSKIETFQKPWLDFLKVRASWGQNGNDRIADFTYVALISSQYREYYFGSDDVKYVGSSPAEAANRKIKWETSEQTNIGIDANFLKNFTLNLDYYIKTTKDWLLRVPVLATTGYEAAPYVNGGAVQNSGVELNVGYQKTKGEFTFSFNGNVSYNKNEVMKIDNQDQIIHGQGGVLFNGHPEYYRAQVGMPVGFFYGYKTDGIFQNQDEVEAFTRGKKMYYNKDGSTKIKPGDVRFIDTNADTLINENDRAYIGNPWPDFTFGLTLNAEYKGFDLSATLQGVSGNQVIKGWRGADRSFNNFSTSILDSWNGEGTSNRLPRVTDNSEYNKNNSISDLYIEDGDYLKIRSINLGYNFSESLLTGKIQKLRLYVSILNLYTLTKYSGMEPEVGWGPDSWSPGHDVGFYPQPRTIMIGANVKF
jgi:TonB-linked SusC/RagA family outer membrane protein